MSQCHGDVKLDTISHTFVSGAAIEMIKNVAQIKSCGDLAYRDKVVRDMIIARLKSEGLSVRQLSRLTGINRGVVLSAGKSREKDVARR